MISKGYQAYERAFYMTKKRQSILETIQRYGKVVMSDDIFNEAFPDYRPTAEEKLFTLVLVTSGHSTDEEPTQKELIDKFCADNNLVYWKSLTSWEHFFKLKEL